MTMLRSLSHALGRIAIAAALLIAVPAFAQDQVDINTAGESELEGLPGLGAATARRIVEYRDQNGPFQSVDELSGVKGISAATIEKLRALVTVGGATKPVGGVKLSAVRAESGGEPSGDQVKKLLERYKNEPTIREVQEAAGRFAEVHPEIMHSWRSRARAAALGPQIRGEYRYVSDADLTTRSGGEVTADSLTRGEGYQHRPLARAQWDLDRLIFNPDELRVSNEIVDLVRLRESVLDQVTKIYYERRRLQVDLDLTPPKDIAGRVRKELRLQELVADLDSMTGGFFSKKLIERGLDPY